MFSPGLHILAGLPGVGTSLLSRQFAVTSAEGGEFLGHSIKPHPTLYVRPIPDDEGLEFSNLYLEWPKLVGKRHASQLVRQVGEYVYNHDVKTVIVDPSKLLLPSLNASDPTEVGELLVSLDDLGWGVAVFLVHHLDARKGGAPRSQIAGCSLWSEMADNIVIVDYPSPFESPESNERTVMIYRRDQAPVIHNTIINASSEFELKP